MIGLDVTLHHGEYGGLTYMHSSYSCILDPLQGRSDITARYIFECSSTKVFIDARWSEGILSFSIFKMMASFLEISCFGIQGILKG